MPDLLRSLQRKIHEVECDWCGRKKKSSARICPLCKGADLDAIESQIKYTFTYRPARGELTKARSGHAPVFTQAAVERLVYEDDISI
jgi:hypothetical protein